MQPAPLDGHLGQAGVQPAGQLPGQAAEQLEHRRQQHAANHQRVEEHGDSQPEANSLIDRSSPSMNDMNTHTMIAAAAVITRPVKAMPSTTAREASRPCTHSSLTRETRNTS